MKTVLINLITCKQADAKWIIGHSCFVLCIFLMQFYLLLYWYHGRDIREKRWRSNTPNQHLFLKIRPFSELQLMGADIRDANPGIKSEACWAASALSFSTSLVEQKHILSLDFTSLTASADILSFILTMSLLLIFRVKYHADKICKCWANNSLMDITKRKTHH